MPRRTNLKVFRIRHHLTQTEMAKIIGCDRQVYIAIEAGRREGKQKFWEDLRTAFTLECSEVWALMKLDRN